MFPFEFGAPKLAVYARPASVMKRGAAENVPQHCEWPGAHWGRVGATALLQFSFPTNLAAKSIA